MRPRPVIPLIPLATLSVALAFAAAAGTPQALAGGLTAEELRALEARFRAVAAQSTPKTVLVKSLLKDGGGKAGFGSGAVISADGYILTCAHVTEIAETVEVTFPDGLTLPAKQLGMCKLQDFSLLKVEAPAPLPFFDLGDSQGLAVGEWVVALGHPGGPYPDRRPAVSVGRVTGLHRKLPAQLVQRYYDDAIRTDAPIFAGNSGGPLVTLEGKLVGLNGAILLINENSYAVPIHDVADDLEAMKAGTDIAGRPPTGADMSAFDEVSPKDFMKIGSRLFGRKGLGKVFRDRGQDDLARAFERFGKEMQSERFQKNLERMQKMLEGEDMSPDDMAEMLKSFGDLFGGGGGPGGPGGPGERGRDPFGGLGGGEGGEQLKKLLEDFFGDGGGGGGGREDKGFELEPDPVPEPRRAPAPEPMPKAYFGVTFDDALAPKVAGAPVAEVQPGSAAQQAGLRAGDLIIGAGRIPPKGGPRDLVHKIGSAGDLISILRRCEPGDRIEVHVLRTRVEDGLALEDEVTLEATLGERKP